LQKYIRSHLPQIKTISAAVSSHQEGRIAIVMNAGRDAMDADALLDEQRVKRTAKSCGPDASTLAFKLTRVISQATVTTKPDHRGERGISRKTIARGMPDCFGEPVVTNSYAFLFCMRGCGRIERPAFPAPSEFRMALHNAKLARNARRD
jgi:hypothetical protein